MMPKGLQFNLENYLDLLAQLNLACWPVQVLLYALALAALGLAMTRLPWVGRVVSAILAGLWLSCAGLFHLTYFSRLTPAAQVLAALFAGQALALLWAGWRKQGLSFSLRPDGPGLMALLLTLHALLGHPLLSAWLDQPWPCLGLLGLDPNPTVLFTLGFLLLSRGRLPKHLLALPALWSFLGFLLAVDLGLRQDVVILPAGLAAVVLLLPRDLKPPESGPGS